MFTNTYMANVRVLHNPLNVEFEVAAHGEQITEAEFFSAYDRAREATDLYPKLIAKTN